MIDICITVHTGAELLKRTKLKKLLMRILKRMVKEIFICEKNYLVGIMLSILILGIVLCAWTINRKQKQLAEENEIQFLYYEQNNAFNLDCSGFESGEYYCGSQKLNLQWIVISLHVYNHSQEKYELTLQDVVDYLASEYSEDGKLMIFSRPEAIDNYIDWYFSYSEQIDDYRVRFNIYLSNNGIADNCYDLGVEEIQDIMLTFDQYIEQRNAELEVLYAHETYALGMEQYDCYKDFSYVNVKKLILNLAAYKYFNEGIEISVEDVKEFLDSEYDENGELYVLNPPENIAKYIEWFWNGGDVLMVKYRYYLSNYQNDNLEKYSSKSPEELDEELLCELIEEFENCPNREEYEAY